MGGVFVESLKLAVPLTEAMAANMERIAAANGSLATIAPGSPATIVIGGGGAGGGGGVTYGANGSSGGSNRIGMGGGGGAGGGGVKYNAAANDFIRSQIIPESRDGAAIVGALNALGDRLEKAMGGGGGLGRYFRATGGL